MPYSMRAIAVPLLGILGVLLSQAGNCAGGDAPTADTFKQAFTQGMMALKPQDVTERNVLFEDVRAGSPSGTRYPFQATASVRDYSPGYPKNKYYGQTCVGHVDKGSYTLWKDAYGQWKVDGRMTLDQQCKNNAAEGVSITPVASVAGTPAPAVSPAQQAAAQKAAAAAGGPPKGVTLGPYECWHFTRPRLTLNFTLQPGGRYLDSEKKPGSYAFDAGSGKISFKGAALDGQAPVFHTPGGRPTVSFRNKQNEEVDFCQLGG